MPATYITPSKVTLAAAVQALVLPRVFKDSLSTTSQVKLILGIFGINYAALIFHFFVIHPFLLSKVRHLPGPRYHLTALPRSMVGRQAPPGEIFIDVMAKWPNEELILCNIWQEYVLVTKPRGLADVLVHRPYDFAKPPNVAGFLRHVLGDGLIVVEGDQHKFLRKNSLPAFSFRHIKDLYPMIWNKALLLSAALRVDAAEASAKGYSLATNTGKQELPSWAHAGTVELNTWASRVTLDIIGVAGLGREFNMLKRNADPLMAVYEELLEPTKEKLAFFLATAMLGEKVVKFLPWRMNQVFKRLTTSLADLCRPMMQDKRDAIVKKGDDHFDVLSLLVKSDNFSDKELTDQLLTYLAAGHETTSSAFSWVCYLLSKHQDIQAAVRKEVQDAFPQGCGNVDPATVDIASILESLPLLNGIINETLRLYPTVPISMREAVRDTVVADQPVPKGARILLVPWAVNRSPLIWGDDATEFRPQRWINADDGKPNMHGGAGSNYHFLTFLHGPRSCIGQGFARAELRCLLATVVGEFDWTLGMDEDKVVAGGVVTIKPANGMYVKLRPLE
ncbi:cytochrome P450 [Microdochium bolleyi]|uniref:Cytochrome P450 n=1 Tax=Microdochium bolleyi TaxID=196109 RepID=A0A136ILP1_9PEZI|nr:cytochrome P450 [Microdochium bolleyi]